MTVHSILQGMKQRTIKHMHFTTWPDFGCPEKPRDLLKFHSLVRTQVPPSISMRIPILVHCSAGVGRTGTFITVDILVHQLLNYIGEPDAIDVFGAVMKLRKYRCHMVQSEVCKITNSSCHL